MLRGLDWSNLFLAGELVFNILSLTDPSKGAADAFQALHLKIYIYGLDAEEANRKVQDIYEAWVPNFPNPAWRYVVKSPGTVTLFTDSLYCHICIRLKLFPSITQVLLDPELDRYAIGFDGSVVHMLPRFARAVETEYSKPTPDAGANHCYSGDEHEIRDPGGMRAVKIEDPDLSSMFTYNATFMHHLRTNNFQEMSDDMFNHIKTAIRMRLGILPRPNSDCKCKSV